MRLKSLLKKYFSDITFRDTTQKKKLKFDSVIDINSITNNIFIFLFVVKMTIFLTITTQNYKINIHNVTQACKRPIR